MTDFPDWGVDEATISAINALTTAINGLRAGFGSTAFAALTPFAQTFTVGGSGILLAAPGANLRYYVASIQAAWQPNSNNNVLRGTLAVGVQCGAAVFLVSTLTPDDPATDVVVPGAAVKGDVNQPITWNSTGNGVASTDSVTISFLYTVGA